MKNKGARGTRKPPPTAVVTAPGELEREGGDHAVRGELVQRALAATPTGELIAAFEQSLVNRGITGLQHAGGFVRSWTCSTDDFASFAAEVFADEPLLRDIVIKLSHRDAELQIAALAATPALARVRRLKIIGHEQHTGRPGATGLAALFGSPHWPQLEALELPTCAIGDAGATLIAKTASLGELRKLDVSHNDLLARSIVALVESPHLAKLTALDLRGNKPGERGIKALVDSKLELEWIDTSMTWLSPGSVAPLKQRWPELEHVHDPGVVV